MYDWDINTKRFPRTFLNSVMYETFLRVPQRIRKTSEVPMTTTLYTLWILHGNIKSIMCL